MNDFHNQGRINQNIREKKDRTEFRVSHLIRAMQAWSSCYQKRFTRQESLAEEKCYKIFFKYKVPSIDSSLKQQNGKKNENEENTL